MRNALSKNIAFLQSRPLKFILRLLAIYCIVYVLWMLIFPSYVQLLGSVSLRLTPLIMKGENTVVGVEVEDGPQLSYHVRIPDYAAQVVHNRYIYFKMADFWNGPVTVFVLLLAIPGLAGLHRLRLAMYAAAAITAVYSILCLTIFTVTAFQTGNNVTDWGIFESWIGTDLVVRRTTSGSFSLLATQLLPVMIWFVLVAKPLLAMFQSRSDLKRSPRHVAQDVSPGISREVSASAGR